MRPSLTVAIDFDDTFTADVDCMTSIIETLQRYGHKVICVSGRKNELRHRQEIERALPPGVPVLLSYDMPKREYAKSQGYNVDIWIDDMPEMIPTKKDILAFCG